MKKVIILGQPRSGSTLVQRVLNASHERSCIAGENKGYWTKMWEASKALEYIPEWEINNAVKCDQQPFSYDSNTDAYKPCWWNPNQINHLMHHEQVSGAIFRTAYSAGKSKEDSLHGFKEIIWPVDELSKFKQWLNRILGGDVYFVHTVRHIDGLIGNGWLTDRDRDYLLGQERALRMQPVLSGFLWEYETMDWNGLFEYLEIEYREETLKRILSKDLG